jgi:hypothetical protein
LGCPGVALLLRSCCDGGRSGTFLALFLLYCAKMRPEPVELGFVCAIWQHSAALLPAGPSQDWLNGGRLTITLPLPIAGSECPSEIRLSAAQWVCFCSIAQKARPERVELGFVCAIWHHCGALLAAGPSQDWLSGGRSTITLPLPIAGSERPSEIGLSAAQWVCFCSTAQKTRPELVELGSVRTIWQALPDFAGRMPFVDPHSGAERQSSCPLPARRQRGPLRVPTCCG